MKLHPEKFHPKSVRTQHLDIEIQERLLILYSDGVDDIYHEAEGKKDDKAKMFWLVLLCGLVKDIEQVVEEEFMPFAMVHYEEPVVGVFRGG